MYCNELVILGYFKFCTANSLFKNNEKMNILLDKLVSGSANAILLRNGDLCDNETERLKAGFPDVSTGLY